MYKMRYFSSFVFRTWLGIYCIGIIPADSSYLLPADKHMLTFAVVYMPVDYVVDERHDVMQIRQPTSCLISFKFFFFNSIPQSFLKDSDCAG